MILTLELTPEQGSRLFAVAKMSGIDLPALIRDVPSESEAFVQSLTSPDALRARVPDSLRNHFYFTASAEQFRAALDELAEMNRDLPALPDEAFDRENLYEDRS